MAPTTTIPQSVVPAARTAMPPPPALPPAVLIPDPSPIPDASPIPAPSSTLADLAAS
jgi:hypothetical protein